MDLHIAQTLLDAVDTALQSTLGSGTAKVMAGAAGVFGTAWLLTFTLQAMRWLTTGISEAVEDILWRILRMAIIVACAFNVTWYMNHVVPFVTGLPVWMGGVMTGSEATLTNQVDDLINQFVDAVIKVTDEMRFDFWDEFGVVAVGVCILIFLCIGGIPFISVCVGTLLVLKAATTLFLVVGPIFIAFMLFEQTQRWFWNWVSIVAGFMLTNVFFAVIIGLALNFINSIVLKTGTIEATWADAFSVLFFFGSWTMLATNLPDYAATAMGGASSGSSTLGGIAGKATGLKAATKMAGGVAKYLGKRAIRSRNRIQ
ncbi:type IV secretion system protein [Pseudomonas mosselii]|uniref:type IV secretion system protein n=1 Tax=Pseudomonas mosselii TaxID=78327 RepID=UPI002619AE55|nr:type IV secretion system protein [Pseudomonas mosselii]MDN4500157.1 type IV secretion system protein [Pseudomonas mosselii]